MTIRGDRRRGMTLIELLIAVVLTALLLTSAMRILDAVGVSATSAQTGATISRNAGAQRATLQRLFRNAVPPIDSTPTFVGDVDSMHFVSLCELPQGWMHTCVVEIRLLVKSNMSVIAAEFDEQTLSVQTRLFAATFRYRGDTVTDWKPEWRETRPPRAIALLDVNDTIAVAIGFFR